MPVAAATFGNFRWKQFSSCSIEREQFAHPDEEQQMVPLNNDSLIYGRWIKMRSKINFVSQQHSSIFILKMEFSEAKFVRCFLLHACLPRDKKRGWRWRQRRNRDSSTLIDRQLLLFQQKFINWFVPCLYIYLFLLFFICEFSNELHLQ